MGPVPDVQTAWGFSVYIGPKEECWAGARNSFLSVTSVSSCAGWGWSCILRCKEGVLRGDEAPGSIFYCPRAVHNLCPCPYPAYVQTHYKKQPPNGLNIGLGAWMPRSSLGLYADSWYDCKSLPPLLLMGHQEWGRVMALESPPRKEIIRAHWGREVAGRKDDRRSKTRRGLRGGALQWPHCPGRALCWDLEAWDLLAQEGLYTSLNYEREYGYKCACIFLWRVHIFIIFSKS